MPDTARTLRPLALAACAAITVALLSACGTAGITGAAKASAVDNSSIGKPEFRAHTATYGVVYILPKDVNDELDARIYPPLRQDLARLGLRAEAQVANIPHVTVVHIHSADPGTPQKMLAALPRPPAPIALTLKNFYTTEAAKDAGRPWWLDLGIVKNGAGFETLMAYNTLATAAMAPLRDGPLPRVTGPVYARMGEAGRDLVSTVGVSGVNVVKDGQELRAHNPHNTLVYSMAPFTPTLQAAMNLVATRYNDLLPNGIQTTFRDVSIVELAFAGNVTREIYRISLVDGTVTDVATGQVVPR